MPTAIITGASRGLGRALTIALHQRGYALAVDARHSDPLHHAVAGLDRVVALTGDITDPAHRAELIGAAPGLIDLIINNASRLGPSPQPRLADYPLEALREVYATNVLAPLALIQLALPRLAPGARIINVSSDAAVEPYPGWGGYGSSKAALEQLTAILAAEQPDLWIYAVDPGDMRTQMHQDAFPGEDISDRPAPEQRVSGFLSLIEGERPSGRYVVENLIAVAGA
ncbi:MAG: SDR family oxidoreductase [Actinomycetota bacterium]|nr:SDR family oxidoreductase [Actinomycetota bacterium]